MRYIKTLQYAVKSVWSHPLNANNRWAAVVGFFRWRIGTRIIGKEKRIVVPWVGRSAFVIGRDEHGMAGNLYYGLLEYEDMSFLLHVLGPHDLFLDVGANIGAYTILASSVVGARTIAFEPVPSTVARLMDQVRLNHIEDLVEIRNIGVGAEKGTLNFTSNRDTVNRVNQSAIDEHTVSVLASTLDGEVSLAQPFILKVDVEGFEFNVIQGAAAVLSSSNLIAVIMEINGSGLEYGHTNEEIHQQLLSFNLRPVAYEPKSRTVTQLDGYNLKGGNTIYIRNHREVSARCKSAALFIVHTASDFVI